MQPLGVLQHLYSQDIQPVGILRPGAYRAGKSASLRPHPNYAHDRVSAKSNGMRRRAQPNQERNKLDPPPVYGCNNRLAVSHPEGPNSIEEPAIMSKRIVSDPLVAEPVSPPLAITAVMKPQVIERGAKLTAPLRRQRVSHAAQPVRHFSAVLPEDNPSNRQAELFYLQKQIQLQTQMVFVLEDGDRVQGVVEWYDRNSIKVRGKSRVLIYKSAIKYLYKAGEIGSGPGE